jgi:CHAT domain-containing protein/tetratricopeptide (TPR) repeat protein
MATSFAQLNEIICAQCREQSNVEIWLIVDAVERPDLVEKAREASLHVFSCPKCGFQGQIDAPLLLYRPGQEPPLIFSPAQGTDQATYRRQALSLISKLGESLGPAWQDGWLEQAQAVQRARLPEALSDDPHSALTQLLPQLRAILEEIRASGVDIHSLEDLERLLAEHPDLRRRLEQAVRQLEAEEEPEDSIEQVDDSQESLEEAMHILREAGELGAALAKSFAVGSENELKEVLEQHPEPYSEAGLALLDRLLAVETRPQAKQALAQRQALYRRCREAGLTAAFSGEAQSSSISPELRRIFEQLARPARLGEMSHRIALCEQALKMIERAEQPEIWAFLQNTLANALAQNPQGKRAENLEQAIEHYRQALEVRTRQAFPEDWARTQNNLANAYRDRIRGDRAENLEQAIHHYRQALKVYTRQAFPEDWAMTQNNLAIAYSDRIRGERAENLEQAISNYRQALQVFQPQTAPVDCRRTGRLLGRLALEQGRWQTALDGLLPALAADRILFQAASSQDSRQAELAGAADIYPLAAFALAKTGQLAEAIETIEAGRARILAETLERNRRNLERLPELGQAGLLERYRKAGSAFAALAELEEKAPQGRGSSPLRAEDRLQQLAAAQADLNAVIEEIRRIPGYQDFLLPLSAKRIRALAEEAPLVYLMATPAGGLALVVTHREVRTVWLEMLNEAALNGRLRGPADDPALGGYLGAYVTWLSSPNSSTPPEARQAATTAWLAVLDGITGWLWSVGMDHVVTHLAQNGRRQAVLIPCGLLSLLPLHAAWEDDPARPGRRHYALDDFTFTYAPSARALLEARQVAEAMDTLAILAIDNPHRGDPRLSLPTATYEVNTALACFDPKDRQRLQGRAASMQVVREALAQVSVLHFSTHGSAGWDHPLESALLLADGKLTLNDLLKLRLPGARLAVLSACETGIPGTDLPDEVVSLPSGLLQAGVAGVAASLWSVADISTAMLMARFYALWRKEGLPPPEALRQAQIWLRDTSNGQKKVYFKDELPEFAGYLMPEAQLDALFESWFGKDDDARSYAHPFFWAAFTYTGA